MNPYRVALSSDFIKPDGTPAYPMFDLSPLQQSNVEYAFLECTDEINAKEIAEFDALILLAHRFTRESVPHNKRLATVARFGVRYDTVDVDACTECGIALAIPPDGVRRPVAVSVLSFLLALTGKLLTKDRITREVEAGWNRRSDCMGVDLTGKTLGILGFGNIGAEIVKLAAPLDMEFIAADPYADSAALGRLGVELVSLEEFFRRSDVLSVIRGEPPAGIVNSNILENDDWLAKPANYKSHFGH